MKVKNFFIHAKTTILVLLAMVLISYSVDGNKAQEAIDSYTNSINFDEVDQTFLVDSTFSLVEADDKVQNTITTELADSITYVNIDALVCEEGENYIPVSYVKEGNQLLKGDIGAYSLAKEDILKNAPQADSLSAYGYIASDGEWNFFPKNVEHVKYTLENQPNRSDWIEHFKNKLSTTLTSETPIIITEAWMFDWNGHEAAVVNASNVFVTGNADIIYSAGKKHQDINLPNSDNTIIYNISTIFVDDNNPTDIYNTNLIITNSSIDSVEEGNIGVSYLPSCSEAYQQIFSTWQYDKNNKVDKFPIFNNMGGEYKLRDFEFSPKYLISDIDGDGLVELICFFEKVDSSMSLVVIYQLSGGIPKKVFSIVPN